jgi:hypothetical protein
MLSLALPVVPSLALKAKVFSGLGLGGGTAAAGGTAAMTAAGGFGMAAPSGLAKIGIVAVLAAGGAGTATVASQGNLPLLQDSTPAQQAPATAHTSRAAGTSAAHTGTTASHATSGKQVDKHTADGSRRSASGSAHGFTPTTGQSNGERARAFAKTRGKGQDTSAAHRHATAQTPAKPVHVKHVATPRKNDTHTLPTRTEPAKTQAAPAPTSEQPTTTTTTTPARTQPQPSPNSQQPPPAGNNGDAGKTLGTTRQDAATSG